MALTLDFKETVKDRIERDPAFREELLKEGIECLLTGDVDTGLKPAPSGREGNIKGERIRTVSIIQGTNVKYPDVAIARQVWF